MARRPGPTRRGSGPRPSRRSARRRPGTGPSLRVRRARPADLPTLVRHRRRMWEEIRDPTPAELDVHDRVYRRWVRRQEADGKFLAFVAERPDGALVGSGGLWLMPAQPRPGPLGRGTMPYILSMYTEGAYRGQGVATRIVQEMIRWARTHRYGRIVLHASRFGRPVYARLGFEDGSEMRLALDAATPGPGPRAGRRTSSRR